MVISGTSTIEEVDTCYSNLNQGIVRKPPSCLNNYDTSIKDLNIDEEMINLAIFGS